MRKVPDSHAGEIRIEEFLKPMHLTQYRLAKEVGVPQRRIHDDAIGEVAIGDDGLAVRSIGVHRVNAVAAQFEHKQPPGRG